MKQLRFYGFLLYSMAFFLVSCGGGETEKTASTDSTAADTTKTELAPAVTTITTPQNMMVVIHKVANYAKWQPSYDEHDSIRLANGIHSYVIGRGFKDSNMVMVAV